MNKNEFFSLPHESRHDYCLDALCNMLMLEDISPNLCNSIFKRENFEVIKIILGAYTDGVIKEDENV